jgi:hypothetical protein
MNYNIQIDHKHKIVRYSHKGEITQPDIGLAWQDLLKLEEFTMKKYNLLSDYRGGKFLMTVAHVEVICNILYNLREILNGKKQAIILDEPLSTALTMLFAGEINERIGFEVEVFATEKAAFEWLLEY